MQAPPTDASPTHLTSALPLTPYLLLTPSLPPPQLGILFKNTSVGTLYSGCRLALLR